MKPHLHAKSSVRKWGGQLSDYLAIHEEIDSSKIAHASMRHRAVFHSAFGIYLVERIHGSLLNNSDGLLVSIRDIAEMHVIEDLGRIPSLDEWLKEMNLQEWMGRPFKDKRIFKLVD